MTTAVPVVARVADVHARITALQTRFGMPPTAPTTATAATTSTGAAAPERFEAVLAGAVGAEAASGSTAASSAAAGNGALGQRAVEVAKQYLGTPYVWGAESPSAGFDCSGLVQYTFKQLGVDLPRVSRDQARAGRPVASLADARPGDLVAFGSPVNHIGIYAGNNKMVVAPHSGDVVKVQEIYRTPTAIRRVV